MDHPLRSEKHKSLRKGLISLLHEGYTIQRQSNIIFVCGGNEPHHMRRRFQAVFSELLPEFEFFEPEYAMQNYFASGDNVPFDITEFEELVGELAHSIVLFPEAPGSFAETGYFCTKRELAKKLVLAIDAKRQKSDSFISLGPAKKINDYSRFQPNIQFDYDDPDFSIIARRLLDRAPLQKTKQSFKIKIFSHTTTFELFALIHQIVSLLRIATLEDIEFFIRSLYKNRFSPSKVKKVVSILVGSKRLSTIGEFGHLQTDDERGSFLFLKDGARIAHDVLALDIATAFFDAEREVKELVGV